MRAGFTLLLCCVAMPALADPPPDAAPVTASAALSCIGARYRGEALRAREAERGLVQDVRWLTPGRNVLRIKITGPGCRFLKVEGVGQTEARILPGSRP